MNSTTYHPAVSQPPLLVDILPRSRAVDAALVTGFALLTAVAAQISIPLGFTPVPITGQTFAVLLAGGALGASRGAASQLLYVMLGAMGLPFYSGATGGWSVATGSTAGYLVGFIVAAGVVGYLAENGQDRRLSTAIPSFLAGTLVIYAFGSLWLAAAIDVTFTAAPGEPSAIAYGVAPFIVGDMLKVLLAGVLLPAAWKGVDYFRNQD